MNLSPPEIAERLKGRLAHNRILTSSHIPKGNVLIALFNKPDDFPDGDHSIRHNRPVLPLLGALEQLGASAQSTRLDGFAPIIVRGPLQPGKATLSGEDSQPVRRPGDAGA